MRMEYDSKSKEKEKMITSFPHYAIDGISSDGTSHDEHFSSDDGFLFHGFDERCSVHVQLVGMFDGSDFRPCHAFVQTSVVRVNGRYVQMRHDVSVHRHVLTHVQPENRTVLNYNSHPKKQSNKHANCSICISSSLPTCRCLIIFSHRVPMRFPVSDYRKRYISKTPEFRVV